MFRYHVYNWSIDSDLRLTSVPAQRRQPRANADVEIRRGELSDFNGLRNAASSDRKWFHYAPLDDGRDYLRWQGFYECLIAADGRRILSRPLRAAAQEAFDTYLLGQVISFAYLKRGVETLHATTIAFEDKAAAFFGDCGTGKSTLAAACVNAGHRLLTDDLLVLTRTPQGSLTAHPGPARIKLMPSVAKRLLGPQASGSPMNRLTAKRIIPLRLSQQVKSPVALAACYSLYPGAATRSIGMRRLSRREAWKELTKATFNLAVRDPQRLERQFIWASALAEQVAVYRLTYPRRLSALPRVVGAIQARLRQG